MDRDSRSGEANLSRDSGFPWNSSDMVSFTKATRLGEMAILSDDFEKLTGRKPLSFRQVCEARLTVPAPSRAVEFVQPRGVAGHEFDIEVPS